VTIQFETRLDSTYVQGTRMDSYSFMRQINPKGKKQAGSTDVNSCAFGKTSTSCIASASKIYIVGINSPDTSGLWPNPVVRVRLEGAPHVFGKALQDHSSQVGTGHSLWIWMRRAIGRGSGIRGGVRWLATSAVTREADRPRRQPAHLL
jgi:hypothetical protein